MSKTVTMLVRRRRAALLGGVALGLLTAGGAAAQTGPVAGTLPNLANAGGATVSTAGTAMSVNLNDASRTMEWNSFSVASDASVAFNTANTTNNYTVLNRVTGANLSEIYGRVTSQSNVAVWLSNPNGIVFGSSGAFSGGSLVLTTAALTAVPTTGTTRLANMPDAAITIAGTTANAGLTGLTLTGSLIVAAQQVAVTGQITATGDVALVAARSVNVPVTFGSNVQVTIDEGTTIAQGKVVVSSTGSITTTGDQHAIVLAGAGGLVTNSVNPSNLLLAVDPAAALSASTVNGRVVIAAGVSSTEAAAGANAVTVAGAAAGTHAITSTTGIAPTSSTPRSLSAASINITAAGAIDLANTLTAASQLDVSATRAGSTVTLGGNLSATAASATIAGAAGVTLGTAGQARSLMAGQNVTIDGGTAGVTTAGSYGIQSGRANDTGGIAIGIGGAGFAMSGATLTAGTEATSGSGFRGDVTLTNRGATAVPLTLEGIDANQLSVQLPAGQRLASANIGRIRLVGDLVLETTGALRLDSGTSLTGSVRLDSNGDVSGRAGSGGLLSGFGRTSLTAGATGKTITVRADGTTQLGDLLAGTIGTGTALTTPQVSVTGLAVDLLTAQAATGALRLTATGAGAAGTIRATTLAAPLGDITLLAAGDIRGQAAASALTNGVRIANARAGDVDLDTTLHARLGTLNAAGGMTIDANGSVTGLSRAGDVAAGPGIDISSGRTLTVARALATAPNAANPVAARVALGTVNLGTAGGAVTVDAAGISATAIDTAGAVTLRAGAGLSVDALGATTRVGSAILRQSDAASGADDTAGGRWSTDATLSPNYGTASLTATGTLGVQAGVAPLATGALGIAQIATATGTSVTIQGEGVTVGTATATGGGLGITARSGGLYLGQGSATGAVALAKLGAAGPVDADEVRVSGLLAAGGALSVDSATDIRGVQMTTGTNAAVTASRDVTGLRSATAFADGRLAVDYGRLNVLAGTGAGTIAVTATNGIAQLGDVVTGVMQGTVDAESNALTVTGVGVDVDDAAARNGNLVLTAGVTGLRLRLGTAAWGASRWVAATGRYDAGIVTAADAQIGTLTADGGDILLRVAGYLSGLRGAGQQVASVSAGVTTGFADVGDLTLRNTAGDVVLGRALADTVAIEAGASARIGGLAADRSSDGGGIVATGTVGITAGASITGLNGIATAAAGANLTATGGSIQLPSPAGSPVPRGAILGDVSAARDVVLSAGALSAQSISGGAVGVSAANGLVVDRVTAATATFTGGGVIAADGAGLTVGGDGALRGGFGFANVATSGAAATVSMTAGNVVQAGTVSAGSGDALTAALAGQNAQVAIAAQALSVQSVRASNGSLTLTAGAGDLYLGTPAGIEADSLAQVVTARDAATLTKTGGAGAVTIAGALTAGATGGGAGGVTIRSDTDILGRRVESVVGDVGLYANGAVAGLYTVDPSLGGAAPVFAASGEVSLGTVGVAGALRVDAGEIRVGSVRSGTSIALTAGGSVTGLGTAAPVSATTGYRALAVTSGGAVTVGGIANAAVDVAAIGSIDAVGDVQVTGRQISIESITRGMTTTLTGDSVWVNDVRNLGELIVTGGSSVGPVPSLVLQDVPGGNRQALAIGYGAANLAVTAAMVPDSDVGTITVGAGQVAQLGAVTAGAGANDALVRTPQIRVAAQAVQIGTLTAFGGAVDLRALNGDLVIDTTGASGTWMRLRKTGAAGAVAFGALQSGTQADADYAVANGFRGGTTLIDSSTSIAGGTITAKSDILLRAVDAVTGRDRRAGTTGDLVIGTVDAAQATLVSAGTMRIGQATTSGALSLTAAGSITGLADVTSSRPRGLDLDAGRGVDVARDVNGAPVGIVALGDVTARMPVTLEAATSDNRAVLDQSIRIAAGQITAGNVRGAGAVSLLAGRAIDIASVSAGSLSATTAARNGEVDAFNQGATDTAAGFDEEQLVPGFGDARLLSSGTLVVNSRSGVAQLGRSTGTDVTIDALAITLRNRDMTTGDALTVRSDALASGNATLTSRTGALYLESATATGIATLAKTGNIDEMRVGTVRAARVTLDSATAIRLGNAEARGRRTDDGIDLSVVAGTGSVTGLNAIVGGTPVIADGRLDSAYGRAQLFANADGARIGVKAAAGLAQLGDVKAAGSVPAVGDPSRPQIAVTASTIDAATSRGTGNDDLRQTVRAGTGAVALSATGRLRVGLVDAATGIVAATQGSIEAARLTAQSRDVTITARDGSISGLSDLPGSVAVNDGRLLAGYGRADIGATAAGRTVSVLAGTDGGSTAANLIQLGTASAGAGTTTSRVANQLTVRGGAVDIVSATATNANAVIDARVAGARVGTLRTGGGVEEYLGTDSYAAGVRAVQTVQLGTVRAATGNVRITSATGDIAGLALAPTAASATDGRLLSRFGRADLTADAAGRRVLIQAANGSVQLGTVSAGQGTTTGAETTIDVAARAIDASTTTANNGALALSATQGALWLGGGSAATTATLTKLGTDDKVRIGANGLTAGGNGTIGSTTDLDVAGPVRSTAAAGTLRITNTGANVTALGGAATATDNRAFTLNADEVNRLGAATIILDSSTRDMTIGALTIGSNAAGSVANTSLRLLGTGSVTVNGAVGGAGTGRTLQIGGTDAVLPSGGALATPANLASTITFALSSGASLDWTGGTLALAGQRIVAGDTSLLGALGASNPVAVSRLVSDPSSALYRGSGRTTPYLTANQLSVTYRDYALFQNGGTGSAQTSGAVLGSAGTPNALALRLTSLGDNGLDSFALFGSVNGFISSAAALQPETVIDFAGGTPRTVRITLANSRLNGCGIGVATAGCLAGTPPPPALSLFDERQIQLFGTDSNPELQFEPLIGTNNEGLIGDLATAGADDQCPPGDKAGCPARKEEVKP